MLARRATRLLVLLKTAGAGAADQSSCKDKRKKNYGGGIHPLLSTPVRRRVNLSYFWSRKFKTSDFLIARSTRPFHSSNKSGNASCYWFGSDEF